jgi:PAS domain S-box-containing protein
VPRRTPAPYASGVPDPALQLSPSAGGRPDLEAAELWQLLDDAPSAVLLVRSGHPLLWANAPARTLFGSADLALTGRLLTDLMPTLKPEDLAGQGRRATDREHVGGRRTVQAGVRADGTRFPAEVTVSVTSAAGADFLVLVRELDTGPSDDQAELAALRERTDVVFDSLAEGVLGIDGSGAVSFGNLAAAQLVQRRRTDLPGTPWHTVLHGDRCTQDPCALADPLALAGQTISPVELRRRGGGTLPVEISLRMLRGGDGAPGVVVTLHDLTERLRMEQLKDELVSTVSHELRTPLTSIRGSLSLLRAGAVDPGSEQGRRMIEIATTSSERLSRLLDDILDLGRLQAGKVPLSISRQNATTLLAAAAQAVSGSAVTGGVLLRTVENEERVMADADRAVQVLINLVGNAVKFSPPGSTVTLAARREGDRVLLSVTDEGLGIPSDQLGRIFNRFAQVDGSDTREHDGAGLGLAIAQGLAEQHGGTLTATSELGTGSTFVLSLPAAPAR